VQTKWIAAAAAGALGIGAIAAGAVSVANAVELRDAQGTVIAADEIRGDLTASGTVSIKATGDHASVVSAPGTSATSAASAPGGSTASAASAHEPAAASSQGSGHGPAAVPVPSADSVASGPSAGSND
jgi:hypothetical protein